MNGVHDMGGMHGFGPIVAEKNEPVFHHDWEGRVFALNVALSALTGGGPDAGRAAIESIPPADYLAMSYYERWLAAVLSSLATVGVFEEKDLAALAAGEKLPAPAAPLASPPAADAVVALAKSGRSARRAIEAPAAFNVGQQVRARNLNPRGHTRLPRYVRGKCGTVVADHGGQVFPDSAAVGRGDDPRRLYTVRFSARELWGPDANARDTVSLDLWEPYLEPV
jgi:nitrile hydratase beta subunit